MPSRKRLSHEEKGKAVVGSADPTKVRVPSDVPEDGVPSPCCEVPLDATNTTPMQDPIVADAQMGERAEENVDSSREGTGNGGLEAQARAYGVPIKRLRKKSVDPPEYKPTRYRSGDLFEELSAIPRDTLRNPRVEGQSWRNIFPSYSTHSSVKHLFMSCGAVGVTYLIPSVRQRPWSPPVGYQCVYESYFGVDTKLWFLIPRLIMAYILRRGVTITQFLNGSFRIAVALMVMAAEVNIPMSVRTFEELTFLRPMPHGLHSIKMRPSYNVLTGHPNKTKDWQRYYFYVKSDEYAFDEPPGDDFPFAIRIRSRIRRTSLSTLKPLQHLAIVGGLILVLIGYVAVRIAGLRSRQPCVVIPGKKRLLLFTRKQQKLVNKARKMKQTPDLSAILKGELKSLRKKKSAPAPDGESTDAVRDDPPPVATPGVNEDNSAAVGTETREEGKSDPLEDKQESIRPEDEPSEAPDGAVQQKSSKKKKGKKRSREASSKKETENSNASREDLVESSAKDPSEERPKKQRKKPTETEQSFSC
ncbi:Uncharacterized protein Rs2_40883 [Raphanus sativus]|nr:Uncharacterized protein Rs2_40883 [Raphanus sativus]